MSDQPNDDPLAKWEKSPYGRGWMAANEGDDACPYPEDRPEAKEWWDGFGDATDVICKGL